MINIDTKERYEAALIHATSNYFNVEGMRKVDLFMMTLEGVFRTDLSSSGRPGSHTMELACFWR